MQSAAVAKRKAAGAIRNLFFDTQLGSTVWLNIVARYYHAKTYGIAFSQLPAPTTMVHKPPKWTINRLIGREFCRDIVLSRVHPRSQCGCPPCYKKYRKENWG